MQRKQNASLASGWQLHVEAMFSFCSFCFLFYELFDGLDNNPKL
mgnify:CR=1 FL=1